MAKIAIPRPEYPRPQFERSEWLNLNGVWDFEIDNGVSGKERKMFADYTFNSKINVPFCPESELSGVNNKDFMNAVWYKKVVELPWKASDGRTILNIGACDYTTTVWVNGTQVGFPHIGGYVAFSYDITEEYWEDFAEIVGIEYVKINKDTTISSFKQELRMNEIYYMLNKSLC